MSQEKFIDLVTKAFFVHPEFKTSAQLVEYLKRTYSSHPEFGPYVAALESNSKDDKYGIFTLRLQQEPSSLEFRLKKPNAYGGPKTENYLERIDLRVDAAIAYLNSLTSLSETERQIKIAHVNEIRKFFKAKIIKDCYLDPKILRGLKDNGADAIHHFEQQHELAKKYLSVFMDKLVVTIGEQEPPKKTKSALYKIETKIMSDKKRPIRVTARPVGLGTTRYIEVDVDTPMDAQRTVSSAKKDEAGVANWIRTDTRIYSEQFTLLDQRETFRSASIVPHDILRAGSLSKNLALDSARRNLSEHIIPALAKDLLNKNKDAQDPLEINFEMLTLLSPIHVVVDALVDPDLTQFQAMRAAFERYQDRTFTVEINGEPRQVKFNGIYHNYGVNAARKFVMSGENTNQKAYNQVIDRAIATLSMSLPEIERQDGRLFEFIKKSIIDPLNYPPFTSEQQASLDEFNFKLRGAGGLYEQMEENSASFSKEEHDELLALNAKQIDKIPLTPKEIAQFKKLSSKFNDIIYKNNSLKIMADMLEGKIRETHAQRALLRQENFMTKLPQIEAILRVLESNSEQNKEIIAHIRAIVEYNKLIVAGTDALRGTQDVKNTRNYEIQSYIERLNKFSGWKFHQTCKSGKDRTNAAIEKQKAKSLISLHEERLVKAEGEEQDVKRDERSLFLQGFQQGPGNDLCGDNMKPGAQQTDPGDFSTDASAAIAASKSVSQLQKGLNELPTVSLDESVKIMKGFSYHSTPIRIGEQRSKAVTNLAQMTQPATLARGRHGDQKSDDLMALIIKANESIMELLEKRLVKLIEKKDQRAQAMSLIITQIKGTPDYINGRALIDIEAIEKSVKSNIKDPKMKHIFEKETEAKTTGYGKMLKGKIQRKEVMSEHKIMCVQINDIIKNARKSIYELQRKNEPKLW